MTDVPSLPLSLMRRLDFQADFSEDEEQASSPAHTRSGRVYTPAQRRALRPRRFLEEVEVAEDGGVADSEGGGVGDSEGEEEQPASQSESSLAAPPHHRLLVHRAVQEQPDMASSPPRPHSSLLSSPHRPCSSPARPRPSSPSLQARLPSMGSLNLLDSPNSACSSGSLPRINVRPRLLFTKDGELLSSSLRLSPDLKVEAANVNPFTPGAMDRAASMDCSSQSEGTGLSDSLSEQGDCSSAEELLQPPPTKRLRVSDMNITRYQHEFLELGQLSSGQFGNVVKARHRLDGIVYAVKITKKVLRPNSRDERVAMNEVFAHAAMMKHRHIVRYFNSWVESGHLHIQNEFCEGGSLDQQIDECRERGARFAEAELKKLLVQVGRGLQYLHGKRLVHLDIKPGNILITFGEEDAGIAPLPVSPDSGAASGDGATALAPSHYHATGDAVKYKIGDLGHVVKVQEGVSAAEEGDCRYMAPEFLSMDPVPGPQLLKADIFSTGLTVYEAARLMRLPKNSDEGADYQELKAGRLAQVDLYSRELQALLRSMVNPVPSLRPTADKLLASHLLNPSAFKSKTQLRKELKQTTEKVLDLENKLRGGKRLVGRGATKSMSAML